VSHQRITREEMLTEMARTVAKRSTCQRLQVGCVIALGGRVLSLGYNGAPSGFPDCDPSLCNVNAPCTRTIHAEANAIAFAAKVGINLSGSIICCTHSPCLDCAKLIINSGIREIYFLEVYRDESPIELLAEAGIRVRFRAPLTEPTGIYGTPT
jgi:dCMP deaminase